MVSFLCDCSSISCEGLDVILELFVFFGAVEDRVMAPLQAEF